MEDDTYADEYFDDFRILSGGTRQERIDRERRETSADRLGVLVRTDPEEAWQRIVLLVERAPSDAALAFIAAGPLEDFISFHGQPYASRLAEQARRDARFREALRLVWGWESFDPEVQREVVPLLDSLT